MTIKLGVSGDKGSFSEEAGLLYAKRANIQPSLAYLIDMEGVLAAIEKEEIDLGILPVVNLRGGLVKPALEAMGKHLFTVIDELWLEVNQCLLGSKGTEINQITTIVSHPQGLAQCTRFLQKTFKNIQMIEWCDTAKAAKDLAEGNLPPYSAVIAPGRCAEIYDLEILANTIQDDQPNLTAFIIVKHRGSS
ncbi:MAG: chorismate mutase [Legionellales bacterium]|nr:chorismate mutase [Legionellales bacterium]